MLNLTLIVLVPKLKQPQQFSDYRPISLCSTVYKILSKLLVARLHHPMSSLVSSSQGALVPHRSISQNILLCHEALHSFQKNQGKKVWVLVKTDFSKAFDRLRWPFIVKTLESFGFAPHWVRLIMCYASSVTYKVRFNGITSQCFKPSAGLHQGDPLSQFLFILCQDVLARAWEHLIVSNVVQPVTLSRKGPQVPQLLFADDAFFFHAGQRSELICL